MIGNISIYIAFITALAAGILFLLPAFRKGQTGTFSGQGALYVYYAHTAAVVAASVYLVYALMTHKFQYFYVYAHTDRSLHPKYLFSAFWAGQEGSFLFWALCGVVAGLFLLRYEQKLRHLIMPVFMAGQSFLLFFLIMDSPFQLLEWVPADGTGLNPLLMDPWMVIHPPVVFIGYALLIIPLAYSVAALYRQDYHESLLRGLPWAVIGWLFLGAGIFIGGVWAYRVLGWGGYWGWDPVENASLLPWLTGTALVHGMLLQREKKIFIRANHFLAMVTYLLVVFATFLTRSGVMADYSVHSFAETALTYYLVAFILFFAVPGFALFALRYREMGASVDAALSPVSRPGSFALTMVVLCVSALLVLAGTLSPLITGLFGEPAGVDQSYFWMTNAPLALALLALLGLCPFLRRQKEPAGELLPALKLPLFAAPAAMAAGLVAGVRGLFDLLFLGTGAFALAANTAVLFRVCRRRGFKFSGGYLAHVGLVLMFIGILASQNYTRAHTVQLAKDQPVQVLGYSFTFMGHTHTPHDDRYTLNIMVTGEGRSFIASPQMYMAGDRLMRTPDISRNLWRDLYISPLEWRVDEHGHRFVLAKGQVYSDYKDYFIRFVDFEFPAPHGEDTNVTEMEIGAILEVRIAGEAEIIVPLLKFDGENYTSIGAPLPESDVDIYLESVDANQGAARFVIDADCCPGQEMLIAEVKTKPMIAVLALGTFLLIIGTAVATWRRFSASA